jgi:hypothetical protein
MTNPSCVRTTPTGVEYCLPDFLPICRIAAAYEFFRPANLPMIGLSKYLFETRIARNNGPGHVPGASSTPLTVRDHRLRLPDNDFGFAPPKDNP